MILWLGEPNYALKSNFIRHFPSLRGIPKNHILLGNFNMCRHIFSIYTSIDRKLLVDVFEHLICDSRAKTGQVMTIFQFLSIFGNANLQNS